MLRYRGSPCQGSAQHLPEQAVRAQVAATPPVAAGADGTSSTSSAPTVPADARNGWKDSPEQDGSAAADRVGQNHRKRGSEPPRLRSAGMRELVGGCRQLGRRLLSEQRLCLSWAQETGQKEGAARRARTY